MEAHREIEENNGWISALAIRERKNFFSVGNMLLDTAERYFSSHKKNNISTGYYPFRRRSTSSYARAETALDSITSTSYPYVYANELIEDCIERIKDYSEDSIPVLDSNNKLKGVLTSQDITELVDDELGEDYAKLSGLSAEEDLHEPLKRSIGKRLP